MFVLTPYLLFAVSLAGIGMANRSPIIALIGIAGLIVGALSVYRGGLNVGQKLEAVLAALALACSVLYARIVGQHYLFSFQYWLGAMLVIRSFRRMQKRDYGFCFLICAGILAHVGRTYDDLPFLFYVLANLWMASFALFHYMAAFGTGGKKTARSMFSLRQLGYLGGVSLAVTVVAIGIFIVMPRPAGGGLSPFAADAQSQMSGFSGNVEIGTFDEIRQQRNIVMLVSADEPRYWRAGILDCYESKAWRESGSYHWINPARLPRRTDGELKTYRFEVFDLHTTTFRLLSAGAPEKIDLHNPSWHAYFNDLGSTFRVQRQEPMAYGGEYTLTSRDSEYIGHREFQDRSWPHPFKQDVWVNEEQLFLQLPSDLSQRARDLASSIVGGLQDIASKAEAVQTYLQSNCSYSLEDLHSGDSAPLDYFLFESRKGHCEYFATAMAILLRTQGVHTRVVQGFTPGTYVDGVYAVRLSDAHMWVEVFFPGKGWKAYDPTPGRNAGGAMDGQVSLIERMRLKWHSQVLRYNGAARSRLFTSIGRTLRRMLSALWAFLVRAAGTVAAMLGVVLTVLLAVRAYTFLSKRPRRIKTARGRAARVGSYFGVYLKKLASRGYRRDPGTTPNDLLALMSSDGVPILDEAQFLTSVFYRTRFGSRELSREDELAVREALAHVKKWCAGHPP